MENIYSKKALYNQDYTRTIAAKKKQEIVKINFIT